MDQINVIDRFYTAFANRDYKTMQACYADDACFSDPVFGTLNAAEVKAMWEMLLKRAPDLNVTHSDVKLTETGGSAHWVASYTFSATGNKVVNNVNASFVLRNGLISAHHDVFDFYTWAKQSLGFKGFLLGWTSFLKSKVSAQARKSLDAYMQKHVLST